MIEMRPHPLLAALPSTTAPAAGDVAVADACRTRTIRLPARWSAALASVALAALATLGLVRGALAEPVGDHMCGDGTTFTVNLPGTGLGIDDSDGLFRAVNVPAVGPADTITLPNGCRLYVLLVSGYHQNKEFDRITFYKVAEFAAQNDGYVHVAWWNNLLKEYMGRPLHPVTVTIERFLLPDIEMEPNPGGYNAIQLQDLFFPSNFIDLPKANPTSDEQFQSDATRMLQAIKEHNPDALIVVAGHSMGGDSVARLGRTRFVPIDLLAVIDPGNNRDLPRGTPFTENFNWTRWRATHSFRGYLQRDCVRNAVNLCRDFDPRLFHVRFECTSKYLPKRPLLSSKAPIACPAPLIAPADPGTRLGFGPNVKRLYHRWQHESRFPYPDFENSELFNFWVGRNNPASILDANYQEPILPNGDAEGNPDKTCHNILDLDPRRGDPFHCGRFDGHGEIVGFRAPQGPGLINPLADLELLGLGLEDWVPADAVDERRDRMIALGTPDTPWPYRPLDPDLCMVCDDIIAIVQHMLGEQFPEIDTTAPVSVASVDPGPNVNGWNAEDVTVTVTAADEAGGSGVKEIEHDVSGVHGPVVTPANTVQEIITAEGTTTVTFFARDNAGNAENDQTIDVSIDKTPPEIMSSTDILPNAAGWFRTAVGVSFPAQDALSGLAFSSPDVQVSTEGAGQEIAGTAEDNAGNQASALAILNIDKTDPAIDIATPPDGAVYPLNAAVTAAYDCTDGLSGVDACSGPVANGGALDTANVGAANPFTVNAADVAGNVATATHNYSVIYVFAGFGRPVRPLPEVNVVTAGRTVPVKYRLTDANGASISDPASFVSLTSAPAPCDAANPVVLAAFTGAAGRTTVRYDADDKQFVHNWKTERSWTGCRLLQLALNDGTKHLALFRLRRRGRGG